MEVVLTLFNEGGGYCYQGTLTQLCRGEGFTQLINVGDKLLKHTF